MRRSIPMCAELQARVVARVFSGRCRLPCEGDDGAMRAVCARDTAARAERFSGDIAQRPIMVDPFGYASCLLNHGAALMRACTCVMQLLQRAGLADRRVVPVARAAPSRTARVLSPLARTVRSSTVSSTARR